MTATFWRTVLMCMLAPTYALPQSTPTPQELEARLRSSSIATVAWAAFQAGSLGVTETVPALAAALESPPPGTAHEREYLAAAVLDALAQLPSWPGGSDATPVQPRVVAAYFDRWPLQTIVVLARIGPAADAVTLELLHSSRGRQGRLGGDQWFALANLLIPRAPIGFASLLLRDISFELRVTVSDPGANGFVSASDGVSIADGVMEKPPGFPPHAEYQSGTASVGSLVVSSGPRTVYYRRVVSWRDQFGTSSVETGRPTADDRLLYLAALVRGSGPFLLRQSTPLSLTWEGPDAFSREVREEQRRLRDRYDAILNELVVVGRLTQDEADALPMRLATTVEDRRTERTPSLPPLP